MNKFIRGALLSGAVVAAMCTGVAATPAHAYVYAAGRVGGVRVGVGVGVGVGVRVGGVGVGYRGYGWRGGYGVRVGVPAYGVRVGVPVYGVRVGYPGYYPVYRVAPVVYPVPVVLGPPMPAEPFSGHG